MAAIHPWRPIGQRGSSITHCYTRAVGVPLVPRELLLLSLDSRADHPCSRFCLYCSVQEC